MATGGSFSYFLIQLTVILLIWNYPNSVKGFCRYGSSTLCAFTCRCTGNCNKATGECLNGGHCLQGSPTGFPWHGTGCRKGNVAYQKPAFQSGAWSGFVADYAVDGNTDPNVENKHCAHPENSIGANAWWFVDLKTVHKVEGVTLYNRQGSHERMGHFKITIGNNVSVEDNSACIKYTDTPVPSAGNINLTCSGYGRYVGYVRLSGGEEPHLATLCEVVVLGYETVDCSRCKETCDDLNGCSKCPNGTKYPDCKPGCNSSYYGENCESRCSTYCKDNYLCDNVTGRCTGGCKRYEASRTWYLGKRCDISIPPMSFGNSDFVDPIPTGTTTDSVAWKWKEGKASDISPEAAPFIGYYIHYRQAGSSAWSKTAGIMYVHNTDGLQEGKVTGLQAGTKYEFDITVYRLDENSTIHESPYNASAESLKKNYLSASTKTIIDSTTTSTSTSSTTSKSVSTSSPAFLTPTQSGADKNPPTGGGPGPNAGVIGGAVVASVVVIAGVILLVLFLLRRRKKYGGGKRVGKIDRPVISIQDDGRSMAGSTMDGVENPGFVHSGDKSVHSSIDNIYENSPAVGTTIPIEGLRAYIEMKKNQRDGFKHEFQRIPSGELRECSAGNKSENKNKNRFGNIRAYDATRVVLEVADPTREADYINANYITGYKDKENVYVATQAPKPHTITDLWRMIWQLNSNRVVMVTKVVETGRRKSEYYWNEQINIAQTHGDFSITTISCESFTDYAIRIFNVTKGDKTRTVRHLQFLLWPDKLAPEHSFPLLAFRRKVRSFDPVSTGPMVIHCSAGVGRTGTFIALDYLMEEAIAENQVDVVKMVNQLRQERMTMIQTLPQYTFVYESLLEALTCGETAIPCSSFQAKLDLLLVEDETGSPLDKQFQLLSSLKPGIASDKVAGLKPENTSKNRVNDIVPADNHRPFLSTRYEGGNDYINAVTVDSYKIANSNIATQMPLPNTVVDFWRLVYDHKCETIVMLNALDKNDETCTAYWPDDDEPKNKYGPLEVKIEKSEQLGPITMREFEVSNSKKTNEEPHVVRQFQVMKWPNDEAFPTTDIMLDLLDAVETWQKQGHMGPLIVHCMDGANRCGMFCAASYMIDKMKVDQEVDVFLAVRYASLRRPEFINTLEQYRFLHELAQRCMSRYDVSTYANL